MAKKIGKEICSRLGLNAKDVFELHLDITLKGYSGFALVFERKMGHFYIKENGEPAILKIALPLVRDISGFVDNG